MNHITIELCAEDRARLDRLTAALEKKANAEHFLSADLNVPKTEVIPEQMTIDTVPAEAPTESTEKPTDAQNEVTPITTPPTAETLTEAKKPSISLEQIQQKVTQLVASNNGAKKARVRSIITTYGTKVSDLKEQPDKWDEVWSKLMALESEA